MEFKALFGIISGILTIIPFGIYFYSIYIGETKPHIYTRFLYALITGIVFFIQLSDSPGYGSIYLGSLFLGSFIAYIMSFKYGTNDITLFDKYCLWIGLFSIPLWHFSGTPLYTLCILVFLDLVATIPTLRKTFVDPSSENKYFYILESIGICFALMALDNLGLLNSLYPGFLLVINMLFVLIILFIRKKKEEV